MTARAVLAIVAVAAAVAYGEEPGAATDGEIWNDGVGYYRDGDATNALRVLRPLLLSKTHGARAAEVVAKLEHDAGRLEESAAAAQIALRASPDDAKANRNFTRATDGLAQYRETKRINDVLKAAQGKDPVSALVAATHEARDLFVQSGSYRTNAPARAVALADALSRRALKLADTWIPLREAIATTVTNEQQLAAVISSLDSAEAATRKAADQLEDMDGDAYDAMSGVESDFTRFMKQMIPPPQAIAEDEVSQSNAWQDVEAFNGRDWQHDALDYTRAFRAGFPAWARAYEQQAQADTNKPPFTAEDQAKVSALATELEKLQIECCEKSLPPNQEKALEIIRAIREALPKDNSGGGQNQQNNQQQNQQDKQNQQQQNQQQEQQDKNDNQESEQRQDQDPQQQENQEQQSEAEEKESQENPDDEELQAIFKKAQERSDEHEADEKARMRKAPTRPDERDW